MGALDVPEQARFSELPMESLLWSKTPGKAYTVSPGFRMMAG